MERFAFDDGIGGSGSYLLTSYGCFQRHNRSRDEQELTRNETRVRNFEIPNGAEREEQRTLNKLATVFSMGYKLRENESAEALIQRAVDDGREL